MIPESIVLDKIILIYSSISKIYWSYMTICFLNEKIWSLENLINPVKVTYELVAEPDILKSEYWFVFPVTIILQMLGNQQMNSSHKNAFLSAEATIQKVWASSKSVVHWKSQPWKQDRLGLWMTLSIGYKMLHLKQEFLTLPGWETKWFCMYFYWVINWNLEF